MAEWKHAWIALGSNLGRREDHLAAAILALESHAGIRVLKRSSALETDAVGPGRQPRYLNMAIEIETALAPDRLLQIMLEIERLLGRDRSRSERWLARTIDLDLLLYESENIDAPGLTVPHPRMHERSFVLVPLAEIAPDLEHPVLKRSISSLRDDLQEMSKREEGAKGRRGRGTQQKGEGT